MVFAKKARIASFFSYLSYSKKEKDGALTRLVFSLPFESRYISISRTYHAGNQTFSITPIGDQT